MFNYITKGLYLEKSKREVIWDRRSMLALGESNKNKARPLSLSLFLSETKMIQFYRKREATIFQ
jgi:hypothetical protein